MNWQQHSPVGASVRGYHSIATQKVKPAGRYEHAKRLKSRSIPAISRGFRDLGMPTAESSIDSFKMENVWSALQSSNLSARRFLGLTHSWRSHVDVLDGHVKELGEGGLQGRVEIGRLATALEDLLTLAKAKIAVMVRSLDKPEEGSLPAWAEGQLRTMEGLPNVLSVVVKRTERLLGAANLVVSESTDAEIEQSGPGRIAVEWHVPGKYLRWIVRPCEFPWPGVDVEVLEPDPQKPTALSSRRFYDAAALLEHLRQTAAG